MRKFKNKKLATTLVVFLLVFILAGAFATFQTILDVRGRINMYAPSVDAIISDLRPVAAPIAVPGLIDGAGGLIGFHTVADSTYMGGIVHLSNPPIRGPWTAGTRFNPRVFLNTAWGAEVPAITAGGGVGAGLIAAGHVPIVGTDAAITDARSWLNDYQTVVGRAIDAETGTVTGIADPDLDRVNTLAWWAWGHQGAGADSFAMLTNTRFARPVPLRVQQGTIEDPSAFETLYLNLTFDQFGQFYYFLLELSNVGVVPLEVTDVRITRVDDPTDATPAWEVPPAVVMEMLQDGTMHPVWANMAGVSFDVTGVAGAPATYTVNDAAGLLGLVNVRVDRDPTGVPGANSRWTAGRLIIPPVPATPAPGANSADIGLRFCVAYENWEVFITGWDEWILLAEMDAILTLVNAAIPGDAYIATGAGTADALDISRVAAGGAFTNQTDADTALAALLDVLMQNALSGTFRIEYTVVPAVDAVVRPPAGVLPTP